MHKLRKRAKVVDYGNLEEECSEDFLMAVELQAQLNQEISVRMTSSAPPLMHENGTLRTQQEIVSSLANLRMNVGEILAGITQSTLWQAGVAVQKRLYCYTDPSASRPSVDIFVAGMLYDTMIKIILNMVAEEKQSQKQVIPIP